jgi:hypothetical protein
MFIFAATLTSLVANFIVTTALISWIWRAKREVESLLGDTMLAQTQLPYNRVIRILTESALPPLLLFSLHLALLYSGYQTVVVTMLWVIFTVRADYLTSSSTDHSP